MILLVGFLGVLFWYLLGILYLRRIGWKGGFLFSANDLSLPIFLLVIPLIILLTNLLSPIIIFNSEVLFGTIKGVIQYLAINLLPVVILIAYFLAVLKVRSIKQTNELMHKKSREDLEAWLQSLQQYAKDMKIDFFTYHIEGKLAGKIIVKYRSEDSREALIQSKNKLPELVTLHIEPQKDDLLH